MSVRGQRESVGVRTRLLPDAAAMPGWEEMTSDISGGEGKRRREGGGTCGRGQRDTWREGWRMDAELSQAVL